MYRLIGRENIQEDVRPPNCKSIRLFCPRGTTTLYWVRTTKESACRGARFFAVEANVNGLVDRILRWVQDYFKTHGFDPYSLGDSYVMYRPIKFPYHVEWKNAIGLFGGEVYNLSTLHRVDEATLDYTPNTNIFELRGRVVFDDVKVIYNYAAKVMNLGPQGSLIGTFPELKARLAIDFFPATRTTELKNFTLDETREMDLELEGFGLLSNWLLYCLLTIFDHIKYDYRKTILKTFEDKLRLNIEYALQTFNDRISDSKSIKSHAKGGDGKQLDKADGKDGVTKEAIDKDGSVKKGGIDDKKYLDMISDGVISENGVNKRNGTSRSVVIKEQLLDKYAGDVETGEKREGMGGGGSTTGNYCDKSGEGNNVEKYIDVTVDLMKREKYEVHNGLTERERIHEINESQSKEEKLNGKCTSSCLTEGQRSENFVKNDDYTNEKVNAHDAEKHCEKDVSKINGIISNDNSTKIGTEGDAKNYKK